MAKSNKNIFNQFGIACLTQIHWTLEIVSRTRIHYAGVSTSYR